MSIEILSKDGHGKITVASRSPSLATILVETGTPAGPTSIAMEVSRDELIDALLDDGAAYTPDIPALTYHGTDGTEVRLDRAENPFADNPREKAIAHALISLARSNLT